MGMCVRCKRMLGLTAFGLLGRGVCALSPGLELERQRAKLEKLQRRMQDSTSSGVPASVSDTVDDAVAAVGKAAAAHEEAVR